MAEYIKREDVPTALKARGIKAIVFYYDRPHLDICTSDGGVIKEILDDIPAVDIPLGNTTELSTGKTEPDAVQPTYHQITDKISVMVEYENLLTMIAEEASELAQAALKYRRALQTERKEKGISPTPKKTSEAYFSLVEKASDVALALDAYVVSPSKTIMMSKAKRWLERLEEYTEEANSVR